MKRVQGFTLIELVVVIVILGILAATALPKFVDLGQDARLSVMQATGGSMRSAGALVYAKAAAAGALGAGPTNVTVSGQTVSTVYGFPADAKELAKVLDYDSTKVKLNSTTDLYYNGFSSCKVTYAAPAAAGGSPVIDSSGLTTANC